MLPNFSTTNFGALDQADPLRNCREKFHVPKINGKECIYFCGNSLGLQPKSVSSFVQQELEDWANMGVEGHFEAKRPWFYYHHFLKEASARLVGAKTEEVVVMNSLTVNLHLMLVSFYQPQGKRNKILVEPNPFPSDWYALESQIRWHGLNPKEIIIEPQPDRGEIISTSKILDIIEQTGDELALVMMGGVNYYSGQYFDMEAITRKAHSVGALAGFDLAHAAGNLPVQLHDWNVDFAVWCTYKYLNSGPGGTSGVFVHERHGNNTDLGRLAGWWGNDEKTRFQMPKHFVAQRGAAGWQLSNAQVLPMAAHVASLEIFDEVGMKALREKSLLLTAYMEHLIEGMNERFDQPVIEIISPKNPEERGCQLSLVAKREGKKIHEHLTNAGIVSDWREPNVIRVAPVPLYNTFEDVHRFVNELEKAFQH